MVDEADAPDPPLVTILPVQLLHKISPWFPFFHMEEEFVLQTAQHGFKPRGMFADHKQQPGKVALQRSCKVNSELNRRVFPVRMRSQAKIYNKWRIRRNMIIGLTSNTHLSFRKQ